MAQNGQNSLLFRKLCYYCVIAGLITRTLDHRVISPSGPPNSVFTQSKCLPNTRWKDCDGKMTLAPWVFCQPVCPVLTEAGRTPASCDGFLSLHRHVHVGVQAGRPHVLHIHLQTRHKQCDIWLGGSESQWIGEGKTHCLST